MTRQVVVFAMVCGMGAGCGASGANDGETVETQALTAGGATTSRAAAADTTVTPVGKTAATDRTATLDATVASPTTAPSGSAAGADLAVARGETLTATTGSITPPGAYGLITTADSVTVTWADYSNNELEFIVYRRDVQGNWQAVHTVPTTNMAGGGTYVWVDTDKSLSAQCYCVAAANDQLQGANAEQCTVRPDPANFPQYPPSEVRQWYGLSPNNDTAAPLYNADADMCLQEEDRTFGVSLGWTESGAQNNVKLERRGPSPLPLMKGEAVALRVWGAGWLTHGTQTFGVDLVLSDTPAYEWYVVGGPVGAELDSGEFALWNKSAGDYLVNGDQVWGIGLNWYQKTLPPAPVTTPPPQGVKTFVVYNCHSDGRPLEMWVADLTAGTGFIDDGNLDAEWGSGGCPATGEPWVFAPTSGHNYIVRGIDYSAPGCDNSPDTSSCERSETTFTGDANGQVVSTTVN